MAMRDWKTVLRVTRREALLLVTSESGDLVKARLPLAPQHPRALITLLEGLALWDGAALHVAVSVSESSTEWVGSGLFGDELLPAQSQLVQFHIDHRGSRARRLRGVADFRPLRRSGS
jgi:hypothetical protein